MGIVAKEKKKKPIKGGIVATKKKTLASGLAGHITPKPKKTKTVKTLVFPGSYSPSGRSFGVTVKPLKQKRIKNNTI